MRAPQAGGNSYEKQSRELGDRIPEKWPRHSVRDSYDFLEKTPKKWFLQGRTASLLRSEPQTHIFVLSKFYDWSFLVVLMWNPLFSA